MKYLYYKAKVKGIAGISDRRACIAVLLAEAKLTNRVPILPKMMLCKNHQTLIKKDMICYIHDTYFKIPNINYIITDDDFNFNNINSNDIYNVYGQDNFKSNKKLVIRNTNSDNFWNLNKLTEVLELAGIFHGSGMKLSIPIFIVPDNIKKIGDLILNKLKKPTIGIHLRMGDRLNPNLKLQLTPSNIKNVIKKLNYNSVYYCSNSNFKINTCKKEGNKLFFNKSDFSKELINIEDNYVLFCIEMYIVDNCDISIRTFKDSSIYFNKQNCGINYTLTNYSMHKSIKCFIKSLSTKKLTLTEQKYLQYRSIYNTNTLIEQKYLQYRSIYNTNTFIYLNKIMVLIIFLVIIQCIKGYFKI